MQSDIRPISPAQAATLAAIHAASFDNAAWNLQQIESSLELPTTKGWVAMENDAPVGFILAQMVPEETEILTFAVHPDAQQRGIGTKLLQKLIETAQTTGMVRIFLEVAADNDIAERLYIRHGFTKTGIRPHYYRRGAVGIDAVLYERILSGQ